MSLQKLSWTRVFYECLVSREDLVSKYLLLSIYLVFEIVVLLHPMHLFISLFFNVIFFISKWKILRLWESIHASSLLIGPWLIVRRLQFIGNVHGDEPVGRELLLLLANWLCDNHMKDPLVFSFSWTTFISWSQRLVVWISETFSSSSCTIPWLIIFFSQMEGVP